MAIARITNEFSHAALQIVCAKLNGAEVVGHSKATAFLWRRHKELFVVTNAHNLAGWDYVRSKALSKQGWLPNKLSVPICTRRPLGGGAFEREMHLVALDLREDDGAPRWYVHPEHREAVDVAVLPFLPAQMVTPTSIAQDWATLPINDGPRYSSFDIDAGDDAFVLGFPKGLDGGAGFPIWKRASIASEPGLLLDGLPKVLVDTATRQGMSGSPVIAVKRGYFEADGTHKMGTAAQFLGIYSGRVDDDPLGAQLGIVWRASVIDQILDAKIVGTRPD